MEPGSESKYTPEGAMQEFMERYRFPTSDVSSGSSNSTRPAPLSPTPIAPTPRPASASVLPEESSPLPGFDHLGNRKGSFREDPLFLATDKIARQPGDFGRESAVDDEGPDDDYPDDVPPRSMSAPVSPPQVHASPARSYVPASEPTYVAWREDLRHTEALHKRLGRVSSLKESNQVTIERVAAQLESNHNREKEMAAVARLTTLFRQQLEKERVAHAIEINEVRISFKAHFQSLLA